jgi:Ca2+/Na+ antiporter
LKRILLITSNKDDDRYVYRFFGVSMLILIASLLLTLTRIYILNAVCYSCIFAIAPYLFLRVKLRRIRVDSSYESDILLNELINQYKINNFNILDALDETTRHIKNAPNMKKHIFYLTLRLKQYREDEELNIILKDFIYSVNTEWIKLLANNIYIGLIDNINVIYGLEDIQKDIKQAVEDKENEKRLNMESVNLVKVVAPCLYVLSIFAGYKLFNIPVSEFLNNQFNTVTGFNYFIFMTVTLMLDSLVLIIIKNKKFDI